MFLNIIDKEAWYIEEADAYSREVYAVTILIKRHLIYQQESSTSPSIEVEFCISEMKALFKSHIIVLVVRPSCEHAIMVLWNGITEFKLFGKAAFENLCIVTLCMNCTRVLPYKCFADVKHSASFSLL